MVFPRNHVILEISVSQEACLGKNKYKTSNCSDTANSRTLKVVTPSSCCAINYPKKFEKVQVLSFFGFLIKQSIQNKEKLGSLHRDDKNTKVTVRNFGNLAIIPEYALNTLSK